MAILSYKGNAIIPAPQVGFKRVIIRTPEGTARQHGWQVKIVGELVLWKGSPDETGTFFTDSGYPDDTAPENATEAHILDIFKKKMGAMTDLFDQDGLLLIQPQNGGAPIKAYLTNTSIDFPPGKWTRVVPYSIEAEAQNIVFGTETGTDPGSQSQLNNPPEESWSLEQSDEVGRQYKLVHTLSSSAKKRLNDDGDVTAEGWEVALDLIIGGPLAGDGAVNKLGYDSQFLIADNVLDLDNFQPYNYTRTQQTDKANGRITIVESWLCYDPTVSSPTGQTTGKAIEDLNIDLKYSLDDGLNTITLSGVVIGLEERNNETRVLIKDRWTNANERFATITYPVLFALAESLSGVTLNPSVLSSTIGKNRVTGVIQYNVTYNNRIGTSSPSFLSEIVEVEFNSGDLFAEIPAMNRSTSGPILQDMNSSTRKTASVTINILVSTQYGSTPTIPTVSPLTIFLNALGSVPSQLFVINDAPRWIPSQGRYTRTTNYIYN